MASTKIYDFIERIAELQRADSRRCTAEFGLQPVQLEVLHYLSICNQFSDTAKALTEYLGQTKGTVSQTLKVLENKGYLRKVADIKDGRITHLQVTDSARQLLHQAIPSPLFNAACERLSDKKNAQIESSLRELLQALLGSNNMQTFGVCHSCRYNTHKGGSEYYCELLKLPLHETEVQLICKEHQLNR
ncbi:MAG: MarR family winged helix-turn-helix transcriptional regulator [Pseudomonadales bacterium]|nr:MarR family winged helix-turn-helix transcriptional regulator [Pseudomonadales bacterium]NRA14266.1 winged helix-turn-helix transcriptional regulator [Oceanospirillaceae bacterium]